MKIYILEGGALNRFEDGVVPEQISTLFVARWLNGAASVEWLNEHPDWLWWAEICTIGQQQADAEQQRRQQDEIDKQR